MSEADTQRPKYDNWNYIPETHRARPVKASYSLLKSYVDEAHTITRSVLFFTTGPKREQGGPATLPAYEDRFIVTFIKRNTSFTEVAVLLDDVGCRENNRGVDAFCLFSI